MHDFGTQLPNLSNEAISSTFSSRLLWGKYKEWLTLAREERRRVGGRDKASAAVGHVGQKAETAVKVSDRSCSASPPPLWAPSIPARVDSIASERGRCGGPLTSLRSPSDVPSREAL